MKCSRITVAIEFNKQGKPTRTRSIYGILQDRTDDLDYGSFLVVKTSNGEATIRRENIISIEDTNVDFLSAEQFAEFTEMKKHSNNLTVFDYISRKKVI